MKKNTLLPFIGILFFAASCKKEPLPPPEPAELQLSGRVVAVGTAYPLAGASVTLYGKNDDIHGYQLLASTFTDSNGVYSLHGENLQLHSPDMQINFSHSGAGYAVCNFNRHGKTALEINGYIKTQSVFVFKLINASPVGPNDIIYDLYFQYPWGVQSIVTPTFMGQPTAGPDIKVGYYYGLTQHVLHYTINKTGTPQQVVDTIFTPNPFGPTVHDTIWW